MATFYYRALTDDGRIVSNKVEEGNRLTLVNKLKENGLHPISIQQRNAKRTKVLKKKKRNISDIQDVLENVNTTVILNDNRRKLSVKDKINKYLGTEDKVTERDISIFTQNFYLLKKANFNNVHALTTIIDSTENLTLVEILEDILAGVEAGDYMYKTMEYYSNIFPYIYINMIRVGELSGSLENLGILLEYLKEEKKELPEPYNEPQYNGKIALRLPKRTHQKVAYQAKEDGVSINTFLVAAVENYLGKKEYEYKLEEKTEQIKNISVKACRRRRRMQKTDWIIRRICQFYRR